MSLSLHEHLIGSKHFTAVPSKKDEHWRYSPIHTYLDQEFHNTSQEELESTFKTPHEYWLLFKDSQLHQYHLPDSVHVLQHTLNYENSINPFASLSQEAYSPVELRCHEDVSFAIYFEYSSNCFIPSSINIILKERVTAEVLLKYEGADNSFVTHASQLQLGYASELKLTQIESLEKDAKFISQNSFHLHEKSHLDAFYLLNSGSYLHNFIEADLHNSSKANIRSLLLASSQEKYLISANIKHFSNQAKSQLLSRQVVKDKAFCLFDANSCIHEHTKANEVLQSSRSLLLDEGAEVFSKPILEIYSDDLKASHGSTVGELDKEAIAYLCSRGIHTDEAKKILVAAFINELVDEHSHHGFHQELLAALGENHES